MKMMAQDSFAEAIKSAFAYLLIAFGLVVGISHAFYWDVVGIYHKEFWEAHPILYPFVGALLCGVFDYWIITDIKNGKRNWEGIYVYRFLLFSGGFLVFAGWVVYELGKVFW